MGAASSSPGVRWRRMGVGVATLALLGGGLSGCGGKSTTGADTPDPTLVYPNALTVCTDTPYKPFEFRRNGLHVGFDIEVATRVADHLEVSLDVVDVSFDEITSGEVLNDGTCDMAISAMTINGERARVLDFSSNYFDAAQSLVVAPGSDIGGVADLAGARVGVQSGTTADDLLVSTAPEGTQIVRLDDLGAIRGALLDGSVDAVMVDNGVVSSLPQNLALTVAQEISTGEQYGIAVKKDGNADLLRVINEVLSQMREDGSYDKLYKKWFGTAKSS